MATAGTLTYETKMDTSGYQKGINSIQSKAKSAGSTVKSIIAGLGITKLISAAISTINSSIDSAVSRVDTLNNFPKVMSNLGISSEAAEKSIKKMSDKLAGLPTTLDQGASAVQRFTSKNNDVEKSTDIFLALNNAILAGGAPTEQQTSALQQLSDAYAKGKPDMQDWRSAMTAMPAQLNQVAEAMGYGKHGADQLGEALRNGDVSMDEFMDTIVKLNEEGVDGLASFSKQAKAGVEGIGTSITVAKTQVVKGVADIIKALDVKLETLGFNGISGLIEEVGKKAKIALDTFSQLITGDITVKQFIDLALNAVNGFMEKINENIPQIVQKGTEILSALIQSLTENLPQLFETGVSIISNLVKGIAQQLPMLISQVIDLMHAIPEAIWDNMDLIVDAGIELIIGLTDGLIQALPKIIEEIPVIIDKIVNAITENLPKIIDMGIELIVKLIFGIIEALPKLKLVGPQIVMELIGAIIKMLPQLMLTGPKLIIALITGMISSLPKLAQTAKDIVKTIIDGIKNLPNKMVQWGKDAINGFIKGIKQMIGQVGNAAKSVANKIKSFLHFSRPDEGPLREYEKWMPDMIKGLAKTMEQSSNILGKQSKELAQEIKDNLTIDYLDDIYKDLEKNVNIQAGEMAFSGVSGSVSQILTATGTTTVVNENKLLLDGDVIYENQKTVAARKNMQTQFGGGYSVSN